MHTHVDDDLLSLARAAHDEVRAGRLRGPALLARLLAVPLRERDAWVDVVLGLDESADDVAAHVDVLPPGAVPYLPCGVDAIVHAVRDAAVSDRDVFVDLGSGVGRVAVLVHLLTGARAVGVELQAPLVAHAWRTCARLGLDADVAFVLGNAAAAVARDAANHPDSGAPDDDDGPRLDDGTVFFIYASFSPPVLRAVLRGLERVARQRSIVVCTVGFDVVDQPWLTPRASSSPELAVYGSR